jgi:hypothetical protein
MYRLRSPEGLSTTQRGADLEAGLLVAADTPFRSVLMSVERFDDEST